MERLMNRLVLTIGAVALVGCSGVKFNALPSEACRTYKTETGGDACHLTPDGYNQYDYSVQAGEVDILVVDDNSGSMYTEQSHMAERFPGFLDSLHRLDYHLGIITTDLGNNGGLLSFSNGQKYLANSSRLMDAKHYDNITQFQKTVKRDETLLCDSSGYATCPSGDERGIYSLIKAMERADQKPFFRPGGHLAVIVLSDEDERSNGGRISGYPLETNDLPETFVAKTRTILGATKTVSVHSIIVQPGDVQCFNTQNSQSGVKAFYGEQYALLSNPSSSLAALGNIVPGSSGSICSDNYTRELGDISASIRQNVEVTQLPCHPHNDLVSVTFNPAPAQQVAYSVDAVNRLHLSPAAPAGTKVTLSFKCKI